MKETWRWFGPSDAVSIAEVRQTGATGVVSALHDVPTGAIWPIDRIAKRVHEIEGTHGRATGLTWDVVESLPVSETIKTQNGPVKEHLEAYRTSLRNLAEAGPKTICYNFMPVLDWTRTSLNHPLPNGGTAMHFDLIDFAVFDCFLLSRDEARDSYSQDTLEVATDRFGRMDDAAKKHLTDNVIAGLPGANDGWSLDDVSQFLTVYQRLTPESLRQNLIDFLAEVVPLAEEHGLSLCCHPDDPPFSLMGLPRVMSSLDDYMTVIGAVDSPANGVTFCTGSLGVAPGFDPVAFIAQLGHRIHFIHLRNTVRVGAGDSGRYSFTEAEHLTGDTDMVATMRALLAEESRRKAQGRPDHSIPMRPDHGHVLLTDVDRPAQPGYPLIGRMRGLAELRGLIHALS